jgi:hypothetical protein
MFTAMNQRRRKMRRRLMSSRRKNFNKNLKFTNRVNR